MEMQWAWYDYVVENYVYRTEGPQDDETALRFLPQLPAARGLYQVRRELGDSISKAMLATLKACLGEVAD